MARRQRMTASGQSFSCSLACAIEALAKASACCACVTASSNLPAVGGRFRRLERRARGGPLVLERVGLLVGGIRFGEAALKSSADAAKAAVVNPPIDEDDQRWFNARLRMTIPPSQSRPRARPEIGRPLAM